jgi:hypothetical protein
MISIVQSLSSVQVHVELDGRLLSTTSRTDDTTKVEHPKIETKLIGERFVSVMGECVIRLFIMKRYKGRAWKLNRGYIYIYQCRCDERLKVKSEESTHLTMIHWVEWGQTLEYRYYYSGSVSLSV